MAKKRAPEDSKEIENRRARFDYHVLGTLECGMVLRGSEVKSVREGKISLAEGYVRPQAVPPELLLYNVNISEYGPAGPSSALRGHNPTRARKLLAHKKEIVKLAKEASIKGMTIVPLKLYFKNGYAKLLIGIAKGKSKSDKRQSIGAREAKREMDRAMSRRA